jgi:hypothetical protein
MLSPAFLLASLVVVLIPGTGVVYTITGSLFDLTSFPTSLIFRIEWSARRPNLHQRRCAHMSARDQQNTFCYVSASVDCTQ